MFRDMEATALKRTSEENSCAAFFSLNIFSSDIATDESKKKTATAEAVIIFFFFFFGLGAKADVVCHNGKLVCYN